MAAINADLECYVMGDQPTTCGLCGARTSFEVEDDGTQTHQCLNQACKYQFIAVNE